VIAGTGPLPRRPALRRFATGLVVYGLLGLAISALVLLGLLWMSSRLGALTGGTDGPASSIVDTLDGTATALTDSGASATSFVTTLDRTSPAVRQSAQAIADLRGNFLSIESQLGQLDIFGALPFTTVADQFGQMAADLEGLDTQLVQIADDLDANRAALDANATSLAALGDRLSAVSDDLRGTVIGGGVDDLRVILTVLGVALAVWVALPAGGALWIGLWLRRQLDAPEDVTP
jgi:hypothetical protein